MERCLAVLCILIGWKFGKPVVQCSRKNLQFNRLLGKNSRKWTHFRRILALWNHCAPLQPSWLASMRPSSAGGSQIEQIWSPHLAKNQRHEKLLLDTLINVISHINGFSKGKRTLYDAGRRGQFTLNIPTLHRTRNSREMDRTLNISVGLVCFKGRIAPLPDESNLYLHSSRSY